MKTSRKFRTVMTMLFMMMGACWMKAQQAQAKTLPQYVDTGKPVEDAAKYDSEKRAWLNANPQETKNQSLPWGSQENKQEWVTKHPEAYEAVLAGSYQENAEIITREDFEAADKAKQEYFLAHPELFIIK